MHDELVGRFFRLRRELLEADAAELSTPGPVTRQVAELAATKRLIARLRAGEALHRGFKA